MWKRRRYVRVHLKGDAPSLSGFLVGRWDGRVILELAKLHESVDSTVPLDGRVEIPWRNVLLIQRLSPTVEAS